MPRCTGLQVRASQAVHRRFYSVFAAWGRLLSRRPWLIILVSLCAAVLASTKLLLSFGGDGLPYQSNGDKLWVPEDAEASKDQESFDAAFNPTGAFTRQNFVYFLATSGGTVLTAPILQEVYRFRELARRNLTATDICDGGCSPLTPSAVGYSEVCDRAAGDASSELSQCLTYGSAFPLFEDGSGNVVLDLTDAEILEMVESGTGVAGSLYPPGGNVTFDVRRVFGGLEYDGAGKLVSAKAVKLGLPLEGYKSSVDAVKDQLEAATAWEDQLNLLVGEEWTSDPPLSRGSAYGDAIAVEWESPLVDAYPNTAGAIERELSGNISGDVIKINIGFILIGAYALAVFFKFDPRRSRSALAIAGLVSCALSVGVAYGFTTLIGYEVNPVVTVLPFILLGIGVDDMFVLEQALSATDKTAPPAERMAACMGSAGVSITVTSLTDLVAFALGSTSSLPALAAFCCFATIGITADYLLQISFFAGWMALDAHREAAGKPDCCPCCGPLDPSVESGCCGCFANSCAAVKAPEEGLLRSVLRRHYAPALARKPVQVAVVVCMAVWAAVCGWQASKLSVDFEYRWFVGDDAVLQRTFDVEDEYFGGLPLDVNLVTPSSAAFDYSAVSSQLLLEQLAVAAETDPWVDRSSLVSFQRALLAWAWAAKGSASLESAAGGPPSSLADALLPPADYYSWLNEFVTASEGGAFARDVLWVDAAAPGQGLSAARLRATQLPLTEAADEIDAMDSLRASVASVPIEGAYAYGFQYLYYEQYKVIQREMLTNLGLAIAAVFVIVLLILAELRTTLLVMLCVLLTDVSILGVMQMWGLTIDSVSVVNLVLAIGLAVDYSAHVAHAFVIAKGTHTERMQSAVSEMGTAVIHGAFSTFLAVLVLSASQSYIFRVFFKQFFSISVFGVAHGLLLLPVLLVLVGPPEMPSDGDAEEPKGGYPPAVPDVPETQASARVAPGLPAQKA